MAHCMILARVLTLTGTKKKVTNDADRLRKYLQKFDLTWQLVAQ